MTADGYIDINCFFVSEELKGRGNVNLFQVFYIRDSREQGKLRLEILYFFKKIPFLSEPRYMQHR